MSDLSQSHMALQATIAPTTAAKIFHGAYDQWPEAIIYPVGALIDHLDAEQCRADGITVITSIKAKGLCYVGPIFRQRQTTREHRYRRDRFPDFAQ
jgi:hypothetical protein